MAEAKTKPTKASVAAYVNAIDDAERRKDCKTLVAMMKRVTGCAPKMWGPTMVGFDSYHYRYDSGREGDSLLVGFSSRGPAIAIYLTAGYEAPATKALLAKLGPHKTGASCLYVKRLADVQLPVLEQLVERSAAEMRRRYPRVPARA